MIRRVIKRVVYSLCRIRMKTHVTMRGKNYRIGPSASVVLIDGSNKNDIILGDFVDVYGQLYSQTHGKIIVGSYVRIGRGVQIRSGRLVEIGNNSIISANVIISDNNNHPLSVQFRKVRSLMPPSSEMHLWKWSTINPIVIKENVWVGENARICKGVTVGKNSIVAASAIVTKDVPDNCIVAGNPARIVRKDIDQLSDPVGCQSFDLFIKEHGESL